MLNRKLDPWGLKALMWMVVILAAICALAELGRLIATSFGPIALLPFGVLVFAWMIFELITVPKEES